MLYLALEDGDRRLQGRARHLLDGEPIPPAFEFVTDPRGARVLDLIGAWLDVHGDRGPLVMLDTLGRVMPPAAPGEGAYERDYRIGAALKRLVDDWPGATLLVVHHVRKMAGADWMDSTSGTNGLNGAADWTINLGRERNSDRGVIRVTGRDVPEAEYAVTVDEGRWTLDGGDLAEAAARAGEVSAKVGLGDDSARIVKHLTEAPAPVRVQTVAEALDMPERRVRTYLGRLKDAGRIDSPGRGLYWRVSSESSVSLELGNDTHDSDDTRCSGWSA